MSERRFTDKPELNPQAVRSLAADHPAMTENRTLFPSTVVEVTEDNPERILISGRDNRKIGATVEKGKFKGYSIFCLSLEERATCPTDCSARGFCMGNGMQYGRRHRIGDPDVFFDRLGLEIVQLLDDHVGLLIRLHVLGDFPSVEYVSFWKEVLDEYPEVACYGYSHRAPTSWGGDEIGDAIQAVKDAHPDRFRIRWSTDVARQDGAIIIDHVPDKPRTANNELVCPAQTDATACCASCGLCWSKEFSRECIAFVKHGPKSDAAHAEAIREPRVLADLTTNPAQNIPQNIPAPSVDPALDRRRVKPIALPTVKPLVVPVADMPEIRQVKPTDLIVEESYQRELSGKSIGLIKKIVGGWDWAKFKPPVCAESDDGLFVIDGQHTAIAAASHPHIVTIPVMVVKRREQKYRADAFVSQNRDRVNITPYDIFHAEVTAGAKEAVEIMAICTRAGVFIPRSAPQGSKRKTARQVVAVGEVRSLYRRSPKILHEVLEMCSMAEVTVTTTAIRGMTMVMTEPRWTADVDVSWFVGAMMSFPDLEAAAMEYAARSEQNRFRACAVMLHQKAKELQAQNEESEAA